jgi:hypothetical protein
MIETPTEVALPHSDELARIHDAHRLRGGSTGGGPASGSRWRRRAPLLVGIGAVAAATILLAAITTRSDQGRERPPDVEISLGDLTTRVGAAVQALPADTILYETYTMSGGDAPAYRQSWYDPVTAARHERIVTLDGDVVVEGGWPEAPGLDEAAAPGLAEPVPLEVGQCDPVTHYMFDETGAFVACDPGLPDPPQHAWRMVDHCQRTWTETTRELRKDADIGYVQTFLDQGGLVVDGTQNVDGRDLIRIITEDGSGVTLVDPDTYLPVQSSGEGETTTYEYLPRTEENLQNLATPVPDGYRRATPEDPPNGFVFADTSCD